MKSILQSVYDLGAKLRISGETDCLKTALGVAKRPWKVLQKRRMVLQNSAKGAA
jgi:hypothetical protein